MFQRESGKVAEGGVESHQILVHCNGQDFVALSRQILSSGSCLRFEAKGGSMHPFIQDGDIVVVEPAEFSNLRLGEIAFYRVSDEAVLAHRIVRKVQQDGIAHLFAQGDAGWGLDGPVSPAQILGRITAIERHGRLIRLDGRGSRWLGLAYSNGRVLYRYARAIFGRLAAGGTATLRHIVRRANRW
jgi:signal peptidase I